MERKQDQSNERPHIADMSIVGGSGGERFVDARAPNTKVFTLLSPRQTTFFDLPRELRDNIYELCMQDVPYAHRGRREIGVLPTNSWEISYKAGPQMSLLTASRPFSDEYMDTVLRHMHVIVHLSHLEKSITERAPWTDSLPRSVKDTVRIARLVVSLGNDALLPDLDVRPRYRLGGTYSETSSADREQVR